VPDVRSATLFIEQASVLPRYCKISAAALLYSHTSLVYVRDLARTLSKCSLEQVADILSGNAWIVEVLSTPEVAWCHNTLPHLLDRLEVRRLRAEQRPNVVLEPAREC
jgi:hypothetical protein